MIATIAFSAAVGFTTFNLPSNPRLGFAIDRNRHVLLGVFDAEKRKVKVVRYTRSESSLKATRTYAERFSGPVEILPLRDGFAVVDFEGSMLWKFDDSGKVLWKAPARYPNVARVDFQENLWFFFNSGVVAAKTPNSSVPEPVLKPSGEEIAMHALTDLAPLSNRAFWVTDELGGIHYFDSRGNGRTVTRIDGIQRVFGLRSGSLLLFDGVGFKVLSISGQVNSLFKAPSQFVANLGYMGRAYDGRLVMCQIRGQGGIAVLFDYNLGGS